MSARFWMALLALLAPAVAFAHTPDYSKLKGPGEFSWGGISAGWFTWDFHPSILIGTVTLVALYVLANTRWRKQYGWSDVPATPRQRRFFGYSVALLYLTLDGPLHHLSDDLLFSAHMLQHMLLQLLWAPLLILSIPEWLWAVIVRPRWIHAFAVKMSRPMTAFFVYNGVVWGWHYPNFYETALEQHGWHIFQHLLFMAVSLQTWFVVLGPLTELRPTYGARMVFIFAHMVAMKALGLTISLSDHVLYPFYARAPRLFGIDALGDQQLGGMLMWLPGGGVLWAGLGRVWWQWVRKGTPAKGLTGIPAVDAARAAGRAAQAAEAAAGQRSAG